MAAQTLSQLCDIWKEVLGDIDIDADRDFFEVGGDSIQMMTVLFRIGEVFGIEVGPEAIFENPTLRSLADHIVKVVNAPPLANPDENPL